MARTITVSEEAFEALRRLKRSGESYSQLILRLARLEEERRRRLLELAGAWSDVGEEEARGMLERARREWRTWAA